MSGRALSLSPKKGRSISRRNGPLDRPDRTRRVKREEEDDVFIKAESKGERHYAVKTKAEDVVACKSSEVVSKKEELPEDDPKPEPSEKEAVAMEYLRFVGAAENTPKGFNLIDPDGTIFNPTQEVQRYEYFDYHNPKEKFRAGGCKPDDWPGEHWCHFFRDGYKNYGYRYLNSDGGTFYQNPDGSQYYFNHWKRWFKPSSVLISSRSRSARL